ncbi:MAG TPA: hypothetical protein VGK47_03130 [Nitrososphaeraceae archaeon]
MSVAERLLALADHCYFKLQMLREKLAKSESNEDDKLIYSKLVDYGKTLTDVAIKHNLGNNSLILYKLGDFVTALEDVRDKLAEEVV